MNTYLGIELGSTRIKAVAIDESYALVSEGDYTWKSIYENGVWTYSLDEVWKGLRATLASLELPEGVTAMGVSAMMHGYLAFDQDWNLLVPFRTWQNTCTGPAAAELTELFSFNIPQRWSIAHLYQAILNNEPHVEKIAHITTLAGYVHHMLTGVNAVGVGEASGMFPIDSQTLGYNEEMLQKFEDLTAGQPWNIRDILPDILPAGKSAGTLTENGASLLGGHLPAGIPLCPPEGDAGTGMVATNAVAARTGNVSAGTSIFSMVVLERSLQKVHEEIDIVTTPNGKPVAMVHCNNCTNDMNAWVKLLGETITLFGIQVDTAELYTKLYEKSLEGETDCCGVMVCNYLAGEGVTLGETITLFGIQVDTAELYTKLYEKSLEGETDCCGVMVCNYLAGEGVTHLDEGRPLVLRRPDSQFNLANFLRAQLYSTMATLKIGMDILQEESVQIDRLMGHGGLFKTPVVGQKYMAAACGAPVTCMETAGEGGPYGMALLAAYLMMGGSSLEDFLEKSVFASVRSVTLTPDVEDMAGFHTYLERYKGGLVVERTAVNVY